MTNTDQHRPEQPGLHGEPGTPTTRRRRQRHQRGVIDVQGVRVDPLRRRVWRDGDEVRLTRMEFRLLHCLISNAGTIVSRPQLMREVWNTTWPTMSSSKTIDVHLGWVRRKLGDNPRSPRLITTVRGQGLRFELRSPDDPS